MMNRWVVALIFSGLAVAGTVLVLLSAADEAGWFEAEAAAPNAVPVAAAELPHDPLKPPRLVAAENEFHFGVMDIGETGEHEFVVGNEGLGDLILELSGTSCKCTLADLPDRRIPPGEERKIRLEWDTQDKKAEFRHGAILRTNDPDRPELQLVVSGSVRRRLVREPNDLVIIGRALPNQRTSHGVWFYSQLYPALQVTSVKSSHPYLTWEVEPAREDDIKRWGATAALKLRITLEPGQPEGRFGGALEVQLHAPGFPDDQQPPLEVVDVHTQVRGNDARLFGQKLEPGKVLNLGQLIEGEGTSSTVFVAIPGAPAVVQVQEIHASPGFLQVHFEPDDSVSTDLARFKIVVTVPEDAPCANFLGTETGEVRITTDHPGAPEIKFRVAVAIAPPPSSVFGVVD